MGGPHRQRAAPNAHPAPLRCGPLLLEWGCRTFIMATLNVTPDSFSGDGIAGDAGAAVARAVRFADDGADIIDVGGESTRPGAAPVTASEELRRVLPVLELLPQALSNRPVAISIDTYKAEVADAALTAGAHMVNDVWGLRADPRLARVVARRQAPITLVHNGRPALPLDLPSGSPMERVAHVAVRTPLPRPPGAATAREKRDGKASDVIARVLAGWADGVRIAIAEGVPPERIILDPGLGFGKGAADNLALMRRLPELRQARQPLLLGPSRKETLGRVLGGAPPESRLEGTAAAVALCIAGGADIVRVHDVRFMVRVARVADAIVRGWSGGD